MIMAPVRAVMILLCLAVLVEICAIMAFYAHFRAFSSRKGTSTKNFQILQFGDCRVKPMRIRLSWLEAFSS
jgi:hypothetical protein